MFAVHESGDISDTVHFLKLLQVRDSDNISEEYMQILQNHLHQFESRFQDVEIFRTEFQLFSNAFSVDFKYVPSRYQLELLKLQSNDLLDKYKHKQSLVDFYKNFSEAKFPKLYIHVLYRSYVCLVRYMCANNPFLLFNLLKSSSRSILSDHDLTCSLRLNIVQSLHPNIDKLTKQKIQKMST